MCVCACFSVINSLSVCGGGVAIHHAGTDGHPGYEVQGIDHISGIVQCIYGIGGNSIKWYLPIWIGSQLHEGNLVTGRRYLNCSSSPWDSRCNYNGNVLTWLVCAKGRVNKLKPVRRNVHWDLAVSLENIQAQVGTSNSSTVATPSSLPQCRGRLFFSTANESEQSQTVRHGYTANVCIVQLQIFTSFSTRPAAFTRKLC